MKRILLLTMALCLLLSGCANFLDSNYHNVTPNEEENSQTEEQIVSVSKFSQLCSTIADMVEEGREIGIISVAKYDQNRVAEDTAAAISQVMTTNPICSYAVEDIQFELGTSGAQPAIAVTIRYLHGRAEILRIPHLEDREQMEKVMAQAMDSCESGIVLYVENYEDVDYDQWVSYYATANPDKVMEVPDVTANIYPDEGKQRVVELKFTYQNSRDALQTMQSKVSSLFSAAVIYAGRDAEQTERFFKLYSFLMGLFQNYQYEISITPSYSLLQHGVGDSKAFATVYAAMCGKAGLECTVVTGTRAGEPWYWNIVCCDGVYYHVDLLISHQSDNLSFLTDEEMTGYVWDYSAYPMCGVVEPEPTETQPPTEPEE